MLKKLNPFHRRDQQIATLQQQLADVQAALEAQTKTNVAFSERIAALVRDDAQIEALRRIAIATEYTAAAEKHDRQGAMKRHEF